MRIAFGLVYFGFCLGESPCLKDISRVCFGDDSSHFHSRLESMYVSEAKSAPKTTTLALCGLEIPELSECSL